MILSKVISSTIEKGRLIIKVLGLGTSDIKTVYNLMPFGLDSRPVKNMRGIYSNTGIKGEKVLVGFIFNNVTVDEGETKIFSTNTSGVEQFTILLKNDGNCELGGNTDNLSRHSVLQTQIHQLRDDFNDLVTAFNSHVHPTAAIGSPSTPTPIPDVIPASSSIIDITTAKIDNVKTN